MKFSWADLHHTCPNESSQRSRDQMNRIQHSKLLVEIWLHLRDRDDLRPKPIAPSSPALDLSSPSKVRHGTVTRSALTTRRCSAPKSICRRQSSIILNHQSSNLVSLLALNTTHMHTLRSRLEVVKKKYRYSSVGPFPLSLSLSFLLPCPPSSSHPFLSLLFHSPLLLHSPPLRSRPLKSS